MTEWCFLALRLCFILFVGSFCCKISKKTNRIIFIWILKAAPSVPLPFEGCDVEEWEPTSETITLTAASSRRSETCEQQPPAEPTHLGFEPSFVINHERTEAVARGRSCGFFFHTCCCSSHTCSVCFHCCCYLLSEQLPTRAASQLLAASAATKRLQATAQQNMFAVGLFELLVSGVGSLVAEAPTKRGKRGGGFWLAAAALLQELLKQNNT